MADEPSFPAPSIRKPAESYRSSATPTKETEPRRVVATRAEAPPLDEPDPLANANAKKALSLSKEEVAALLAVEGTRQPTPARKLWKRGRVLIIPLTVIDLASHAFLGPVAPYVSVLLTVGSLVWVGWPLLRRDGWS